MKAHLHNQAPDTASTGATLPSLGSLNAISWRQNRLNAGQAMVLAPNYGQTSSMMPPEGWRSHPYLDAAAGPAPRDVHVPVYVLTPRPPASRYSQVTATLLEESQKNTLQVIAAGPVAYVPGGTASLSKEA
ncbi:MAG: hypothetical protein ACYCV4_02490 [Dermatophilaceae bacterium]